MQYISTRGTAPALDFETTMLTGLARDGGLYVPESVPTLEPMVFEALAGRPYEEVALAVMRPFFGDGADDGELQRLIAAAYETFRHPARAPLVQVGANHFLLELFHGPTLAFKDFAMQLIGQLFQAALKRRGERITIVGATSGDTGSAAIEAFRGIDNVDVFILYPHGRISEVQRRQMTTPDDANVHALALDGDFDDCQAAVKAMFADDTFRDEVGLAAVNSINWARVLAQVVYYVTAATALGAPHRRVSFTVPTGNFGDIFAGSIARRMGLPIDRLVVATNRNDILHRTLATGTHRKEGVEPTISPSMDIQVSSNFERAAVRRLRPRRAGHRAADGRARAGRLRVEPGRAVAPAGDLRQRPRVGSRDAGDDPACLRRDRHADLSAHGGGPEGRGGASRPRSGDGDAGDCAPGQVSRRGGGGHRHPSASSRAAGEPL